MDSAVMRQPLQEEIDVPKPRKKSPARGGAAATDSRPALPGQVVLVLQGGGALGAYQVGVYEAMHEAGVEPDWVIGTSIGAINAAIIAGNAKQNRLPRIREFWARLEHGSTPDIFSVLTGLSNVSANLATLLNGIPAFFVARLVAPKIDGEDHTKDIDFTPAGIHARWQAGYADTKAMLKRAPWNRPVDPIDGVVIHDPVDRPTMPIARGVDGFTGRTK
jgi:hypothetical protein